VPALRSADLLIVIGTSLVVHPFASLVDMVPSDCPRVLINLEPAGGIGELKNDVVILDKCDDAVRKLARELCWEKELDDAWALTINSVETNETSPAAQAKESDLKDEVDKLASEVEASLAVTEKVNAERGGEDEDKKKEDVASKSEDEAAIAKGQEQESSSSARAAVTAQHGDTSDVKVCHCRF
jgi:NAD+-dependent protein deacetylase SIR2